MAEGTKPVSNKACYMVVTRTLLLWQSMFRAIKAARTKNLPDSDWGPIVSQMQLLCACVTATVTAP